MRITNITTTLFFTTRFTPSATITMATTLTITSTPISATTATFFLIRMAPTATLTLAPTI